MMNLNKWYLLQEAFKNDEMFKKEECPSDYEFEGLDLFDWLECDTSPSYKMIEEFNDHGYSVFCFERDSFGWLAGGVRKQGTTKVITFG